MDAGSAGTGTLLWRSPSGLIRLPVLKTEVDLEVTGVMARGKVTQRFTNPSDEVIEVLYVFPLPDRAAVDRMEMRIGPRRILAIVQEREKAKRTYERAKQEGRKAALVEQERRNLFTTSAANINPGETIEVVLEYLEEVSYADGEFSLRFPLTFTPRYVPARAPQRESGLMSAGLGLNDASRVTPPFVRSDHPRAPEARLRLRINAGIPLDEVVSPSHPLHTFLDGETWEVEPVAGAVPADRDFLVSWKPLLGAQPEAAMFVEERDDGRYAMLMLVPPDPETGSGWGLPTETLFVVDVSYSMAGPSLEQAREALLAALDRLRPEDTFNILKFSQITGVFSSRFESAEPVHLERAREWVRDLGPESGTEIYPALVEGLALMQASRSERVQRLIFLTDGAVSNEAMVLDRIVQGLGSSRLHAIGIGHAPNAYLMRKMAQFGRGFCEFISTQDQAANKIDAFLERISRPMMSDVALQWEGAELREVYPDRLPDLYPGEPLLVSFRIGDTNPDGRIVLSGRLREGTVQADFQLAGNASPGAGIATRWARAKVGSVMDSLHEGADPAMVRREVVQLGLAFNLVTRYTSLVAVEDFSSANGDAETVRLANALPAGSRLGGLVLPAGGTWQPLISLLALVLTLAGSLLLVIAAGWKLLCR